MDQTFNGRRYLGSVIDTKEWRIVAYIFSNLVRLDYHMDGVS